MSLQSTGSSLSFVRQYVLNVAKAAVTEAIAQAPGPSSKHRDQWIGYLMQARDNLDAHISPARYDDPLTRHMSFGLVIRHRRFMSAWSYSMDSMLFMDSALLVKQVAHVMHSNAQQMAKSHARWLRIMSQHGVV